MFRLARPRFSLRFKLLVSHLLVLAPLLAFSGVAFHLVGNITERTDQITAGHLNQVRRLHRLEAHILRADAAAARKGVTPDLDLFASTMDALDSFGSDIDPERSPQLAVPGDSEETLADLFRDFKEKLLAWMQDNAPPAPATAAREKLLSHLNTIRGEHEKRIEQGRMQVVTDNSSLIVTMVVGMLAALAVAVAGSFLLTRTLLRPVMVLEETLRAYERGEAPPRPENLPGDEIGDLGRSLREALTKMDGRREHLERLSLTDPLTGLHNRRYLDEILGRLRKRETPAAFVMIDIDHFKAYNDREGHLMGDQLLQEVADLLRRNVRPGDVVARYGGEEFCALFLDAAPGERPAGPETVERLRILFENHPFPRTESQPGGRLTISIGGTHWKPGEEPRDALQRADAALYQAKQSGRNRCSWA